MRRFLALLVIFVIVLSFVTTVYAIRISTTVYPGPSVIIASGTRTNDYIVVQIDSNSQFVNTSKITFRAKKTDGSNASNAMTFDASDLPSYMQRDYFSPDTFNAVNCAASLTSSAPTYSYVIYNGYVYFSFRLMDCRIEAKSNNKNSLPPGERYEKMPTCLPNHQFFA